MDFIRLWLHEASRVYGDKLIEDKDMENFKKLKLEIAQQSFDVSQTHTHAHMHFADTVYTCTIIIMHLLLVPLLQ